MALTQVDVGASVNDGTGDPLREAFIAVNNNAIAIETAGPVGSNIRISANSMVSTDTNGNLYISANGTGRVIIDGLDLLGTTTFTNLTVSGLTSLSTLSTSGLGTVDSLTVTNDATVNGDIIVVGTVDGRDILADGLAQDAHIAELVTVSGDTPHGIPLYTYNKTTPPTASDDASNTAGNGIFAVGSKWVDVTDNITYECVDSTATAAIWNVDNGLVSYVTPSHRLWMVGANTYGQLGDNTIIGKSSPVETLAGGTDWKTIACTYTASAAIKADGTLWTWGGDFSGELGQGTTGVHLSSPVQTTAGGTDWASADLCSYGIRAIKTDGTLWSAGFNGAGSLGDGTIINRNVMTQELTGSTDWVQVAAGDSGTAAIKADGTLWTWGRNDGAGWGSYHLGQLGDGTIINRSSPVQTITGGNDWAAVDVDLGMAALKTDGTLWGWGQNAGGQLGDNTVVGKSSPVQTIAGGTDWVSFDKGSFHAMAIKDDGTLWSMGGNYYGTLGDGTFGAGTDKSSPVQTIAGGNDWVYASAGNQQSGAIKTDGTRWGWGFNSNGELGQGVSFGTFGDASEPVQTIMGGNDWYSTDVNYTTGALTKSVTAGTNQVTVTDEGDILVDGRVDGRDVAGDGNVLDAHKAKDITISGDNPHGIPLSKHNATTAPTVNDDLAGTAGNGEFGVGSIWLDTVTDITYISADSTATTAVWNIDSGLVSYVGVEHTAWGCGYNTFGSIGDGTTVNKSSPVQTIAGGTDWKMRSSGYNATAAIKDDGTLWVWGGDNYGKLGRNTLNGHLSSPTQVFGGGSDWAYVEMSDYSLHAIKTDGTLWSCGYGNTGETGLGISTDVSVVTQEVSGSTDWVSVSNNNNVTAGLKADGTLWCWGINYAGMLGDNTIVSKSSPVQTIAGGTDWAQVAVAGGVAAIKTDGTLWTWGVNTFGGLGDGTTVDKSSPVQTIAGGNDWAQVSRDLRITSATKTDGTLWTWGDNQYGALGDGTTVNKSSPVQTITGGNEWASTSSGGYISSGIKLDGTLWVWGRGDFGSLGDDTSVHKSSPVQTIAGGNDWYSFDASITWSALKKTIPVGSTSVTISDEGDLVIAGQLITANPITGSDAHQLLDVTVSGDNPHNIPLVKYNATTAPTVNDDAANTSVNGVFEIGSTWVDTVTDITYICADATAGAAVWNIDSGLVSYVDVKHSLWLGGMGQEGALGDGASLDRSSPVQTTLGGTDWAKISTKRTGSAGIKTDGTLWTWGRDDYGLLGHGTLNVTTSVPVQEITGGTDWAEVQISDYSLHAIKTDGTLWAAGYAGYGELGNDDSVTNVSTLVQEVTGSTDWKAVSNNRGVTGAIKTDGTLWMWGYNTSGGLADGTIVHKSSPVQTTAGGNDWAQIAANNTSAALKTDGTLWTWGHGALGELGDNSIISKSSPVQTLAGGTDWSSVSAGYSHAAALKTDGTLWTWGQNTYGTLGDGTTVDKSSPIQTTAGGNDWALVSAGGPVTGGIKTDGTAWTWGRNNYYAGGALLTGDNVNRSVPTQIIARGSKWSYISADYTTGLLSREIIPAGNTPVSLTAEGDILVDGTVDGRDVGSDGAVLDAHVVEYNELVTDTGLDDHTFWTAGRNNVGQLLNGTPGTNTSTVTQTDGMGADWVQVSSGISNAAGIKDDGTLWTWGYDYYGNLGDNDNGPLATKSSPVQTVMGGNDWASVSMWGNLYAIKTDGTLWTCGYNGQDQLGDGTSGGTKSSPVQTIAGGNDWASVQAGNGTAGALKTDGTLWTWGNNPTGALGDETTIRRNSPVQTISGGNDWAVLAVDYSGMAAIKTDGTLWTWGRNTKGELGDNTIISKSSPVQTITGGTDWAQVKRGDSTIAAIKTDGTLWTWGGNDSYGLGALGDNTIISKSSPVQTIAGGTDWKSVFVQGGDVAAIKQDGTLWVWGHNTYGQLGDGTTVHKSSPIQTTAGGNDWYTAEVGYSLLALKESSRYVVDGHDVSEIASELDYHIADRVDDGPSNPHGIPLSKYDGTTAPTANDDTIDSAGNGVFEIGSTWVDTTADQTFVCVDATAGAAIWYRDTQHNLITDTGLDDHELWVAGRGTSGQLADDTILSKSSPVQTITGGADWAHSTAGTYHGAGIKDDGTLWTWGFNTSGELGDGTIISRSSPVQTVAGGNDWNSVHCGTTHTSATKTDGTFWLWGNNTRGQLADNTVAHKSSPVQTIAGGTDWSKVSCHYHWGAGIKTDGSLWTWGYNGYGQLGDNTVVWKSSPVQTIAGGTNWSQLDCGYQHMGAIKTDGTLWNWGGTWGGADGELGDNTGIPKSSPIQTITGGTDWAKISYGYATSMAIKNDGTLWIWGNNGNGQLATGDAVDRSSPVQTVAGGTDWSVISCNEFSTAAIKTDGTLWTCGYNGDGQLADGTKVGRSSPVQTVMGGTDWYDVEMGYVLSALNKKPRYTVDGTDVSEHISETIVKSGENPHGIPLSKYNGTTAPTANDDSLNTTGTGIFSVGSKWTDTVTDITYECVDATATAAIWNVDNGLVTYVGVEHTAWGCGYNVTGDLGDDTIVNKSSPVQTISGGTDWKILSHNAGIKDDGTLWTWGQNYYGDIGDDALVHRSSPVQTIAGGNDWAYVERGTYSTQAIKTNGTLWAWGYGAYGELGNNASTNVSSPVQTVAGGNDWSTVHNGFGVTAAIKTDGTLWAWGSNTVGDLGDDTIISRSSPVQTITGGTDWAQISAGGGVSAIKTDGTLWVWGRNTWGEIGDDTALHQSSPVQTVAGGNDWARVNKGYRNTAAIKTDGTLWIWGRDIDGQLGDEDTADKSSPVQTISGGNDWAKVTTEHSMTAAIKTDGTLWTWGANAYGQLADGTVVKKSSPVQTITGGNDWYSIEAGLNWAALKKTIPTATTQLAVSDEGDLVLSGTVDGRDISADAISQFQHINTTTTAGNPHGMPLNKYDATAAPTANDDAAGTATNGVFAVGSIWIDVTLDNTYICVDATAATAVWTDVLVDADIGVNVQAYDATYVVDADIGVNVQAYDATYVVDADIGVTVQGYDATYVVDADIGVNVQGYNADTRTLKDNLVATVAPVDATDDTTLGYAVGSIWIDVTLDNTYICVDATDTAAVWDQLDLVGYESGGGAVTQGTGRTTGVTLNNTSGAITLISAAGSATWQSFTVTNTTVAATDTVVINQKSGTDLNMIHITAVAGGSFQVTFATTGGVTVEQPVFNFAVVKAVIA